VRGVVVERGSVVLRRRSEPEFGAPKFALRARPLTLIDYEALGWETYGILRSELQQAMLEMVPADRLRLGKTCVGATDDGQVLLDGADPVIADIVVGADGIRSVVRRSLFGEEPLRCGGHRACRAGTRFDDEGDPLDLEDLEQAAEEFTAKILQLAGPDAA
jgi:2-polyprenyl-6-methoxyphenol hydroxylase-like FAD-dependent oxidoreductase